MLYIVKYGTHHPGLDYTVFLGKNNTLSHRPGEVEPYARKANAQKLIDEKMRINEFIHDKYPDLEPDTTYDYEIIEFPSQKELDDAKRILDMHRNLMLTYAL